MRPRGPNPPVPLQPQRRSGWSWAWRIFRIPLLLYLALLGLLTLLQDRLIFPGRVTQGTRGADVQPSEGAKLLNLSTRDGQRVVALFGAALTPDGRPRPDAQTRPTLLYFYGNGMCLADALPEFAAFRRLGANVLIPDYLGYGLSGGQASEAGCYAAADAAYAHLRARPDIDPDRIVPCGWSLGGAVAIDLASRENVAGLIAFSTFTSLIDMARRHYPFLPTSLLLRHRFESLSKIGRARVPTLIGHGESDEIIPYPMAGRLAHAAGGAVALLAVPTAHHNDFFNVGAQAVRDAMVRFLDEITR